MVAFIQALNYLYMHGGTYSGFNYLYMYGGTYIGFNYLYMYGGTYIGFNYLYKYGGTYYIFMHKSTERLSKKSCFHSSFHNNFRFG